LLCSANCLIVVVVVVAAAAVAVAVAVAAVAVAVAVCAFNAELNAMWLLQSKGQLGNSVAETLAHC